MPFQLSYPLTQDLSNNHYGIPQGTAGRGVNAIVGIVLHELGATLSEYIAFMHTDVRYANRRPGHPSVHYAVGGSGIIRQFVPDANTAWGIEELSNPTWALTGNYPGIDPNYLFVQIGLESFVSAPSAMFQALAQLVAYVCLNNSIPIDATHIITHDQLSDLYPQCAGALLTNLIATAQALALGYTDVLPNIVTVAAQATATANSLAALEAEVSADLALVEAQAGHPSVVAGPSTLGHVEASSTITVDPTTGAASVKQLGAAYVIPNTPQAIAPSIASIVNFSVSLFDQSPVWVTVGTFWHIQIGVDGVYRLRARVQFETTTWVAGNKLSLDLYKNGTLLAPLGVVTLAGGSADVDIAGEHPLVVTSSTDSYDVRITQTNNTTRHITSGVIQIERV